MGKSPTQYAANNSRIPNWQPLSIIKNTLKGIANDTDFH